MNAPGGIAGSMAPDERAAGQIFDPIFQYSLAQTDSVRLRVLIDLWMFEAGDTGIAIG
jgi:hypothetical protein